MVYRFQVGSRNFAKNTEQSDYDICLFFLENPSLKELKKEILLTHLEYKDKNVDVIPLSLESLNYSISATLAAYMNFMIQKKIEDSKLGFDLVIPSENQLFNSVSLNMLLIMLKIRSKSLHNEKLELKNVKRLIWSSRLDSKSNENFCFCFEENGTYSKILESDQIHEYDYWCEQINIRFETLMEGDIFKKFKINQVENYYLSRLANKKLITEDEKESLIDISEVISNALAYLKS